MRVARCDVLPLVQRAVHAGLDAELQRFVSSLAILAGSGAAIARDEDPILLGPHTRLGLGAKPDCLPVLPACGFAYSSLH